VNHEQELVFMVSIGLLKCTAAGVLVIGLGTAALAAEMGPIESRQACMKANGKTMGVMVPMIKSEQPYDSDAIQAALATEETACAGWAGWWGEDTKASGSVETRAKDEIWSDAAGFEAAGSAFVTARSAVKASTDEASFKAAFPALGQACQGCHEKFRRPKDN
jgi:cytochrome c556